MADNIEKSGLFFKDRDAYIRRIDRKKQTTEDKYTLLYRYCFKQVRFDKLISLTYNKHNIFG